MNYYRFVFAAEILIAELLFMFGFERRKRFWLRLVLSVIVLYGFVALMFWQVKNAAVSSATFISIFMLSLACMYVCFDAKPTSIIFCGVAAYTCQHFAYQTTNLISVLITRGRSVVLGIYSDISVLFGSESALENAFWISIYIACFLAVYISAYLLFARRLRNFKHIKINMPVLFAISAVWLIVDIVINAVMIYHVSDVDFAVSVIVAVYSIACCGLMLSMQYGIANAKNIQSELDFIKELNRKEKEQYHIAKDNIELLNIKCHDMKHQIREIGKSKSIPEPAIKEIEQSIKIYDSVVKTGNEVLDVILTEKSLYCNKNSILLSCVADGAVLSFMDEQDIYSMFGNILDNAIEATLRIGDVSRRIIGVRLKSVNDFVSLNINNYFTGEVKLGADGLPVSERDPDYHGFGMKSIEYIVKKYDGAMAVEIKDDVFNVNILLPVPANDTQRG